MLINSTLTGTSTTQIQHTTATAPTQPTANLASPSTGSGFEVLKGTSTNPASTTPSASPDLDVAGAVETVVGIVAAAAEKFIGKVISTFGG